MNTHTHTERETQLVHPLLSNNTKPQNSSAHLNRPAIFNKTTRRRPSHPSPRKRKIRIPIQHIPPPLLSPTTATTPPPLTPLTPSGTPHSPPPPSHPTNGAPGPHPSPSRHQRRGHHPGSLRRSYADVLGRGGEARVYVFVVAPFALLGEVGARDGVEGCG